MPRRHRLALALLLCGAAPLAQASAYRSVCPADPGHAPSGELTATRVAAATVDDDQDRLYEGAVWKDGALYLSDFVHSGRFPSRIRRFTPPDRWETVVEDSGSNGLALDTEGVGDSSQVVVSGYVLPGLQVKYGVGIFDSLATLTLRYRLMPKLYMEAVSGVDQALDLLYQFEF